MSATPHIVLDQRNGTAVATVHAKLMNADVCQALRETVIGAMATGPRPVVIDLSAVSFMPSMGIGVLMTLRKELHDRGCPLVLAGVGGTIRQVLAITKVDRMLTMADTVEQAVGLASAPAAGGGGATTA